MADDVQLYGMAAAREVSITSADGISKLVRCLRDGTLTMADFLTVLQLEGRTYVSSDADENDVVTGATSFAATTPTWLVRVPSGTTCIPMFLNLVQSGTVAGGDIEVTQAFDRVDRWSSGGTTELISQMRTDKIRPPACTVLSGATAAAATEARMFGGAALNAVAGAGTADRGQDYCWSRKQYEGPILVGPASWLIFTWAGATGPSWLWSIGWAEIPTTWIQ